MDDFITNNVAVLARHDPGNKIGLAVDEWGTWYDPEPGREPGFLYQQNTLRDALVAALNFNIFHRHADRVHLANIAQMVNVLQAMILTDGPRMVLTPTYHVFSMFRPFQDATLLPADVQTPDYSHGTQSVPALSVSAARTADGAIVVALVNLDPQRALSVGRHADGREGDAGQRQHPDGRRPWMPATPSMRRTPSNRRRSATRTSTATSCRSRCRRSPSWCCACSKPRTGQVRRYRRCVVRKRSS